MQASFSLLTHNHLYHGCITQIPQMNPEVYTLYQYGRKPDSTEVSDWTDWQLERVNLLEASPVPQRLTKYSDAHKHNDPGYMNGKCFYIGWLVCTSGMIRCNWAPLLMTMMFSAGNVAEAWMAAMEIKIAVGPTTENLPVSVQKIFIMYYSKRDKIKTFITKEFITSIS